MKYNLLALIFFLAILSFSKPSHAQSQNDLVNAINNSVIPIKTLLPDSDYTDLGPLKAVLKDKQIVGIGEATHGTHEFFVYKHRMLEFLVKQMGYKTFAIEASFAGTQVMNDYVLYGKGDVRGGLKKMGIGVWITEEVADMANWLKIYNAAQSPENKVSFYGFDMQDSQTPGPLLRTFLAESGQLTPALDSGFVMVKKSVFLMNGSERANVNDFIKTLKNVSYTQPDSNKFKLYEHDLRVLEQCVEYIDAASNLFPARQTELRDKFMAENCEWIYNYTGGARMMLWAHNQHIGKSMGNIKSRKMGNYLEDQFQDKYYAFGFAFYDGRIRVVDVKAGKWITLDLPPSIPNSIDYTFAQCAYPDFILDVKSSITNSYISQLLSAPIVSRSIGAEYASNQSNIHNYLKFNLPEMFDGVIFIRHTSPSTTLKPAN